MTLQAYFEKQDFSRTVTWPQVTFRVKRLTWRAEGGPAEAVLEACGPENALWNLMEMLRCPVEVQESGEAVWWGFVETVTVQTGSIRVGVSLAEMYNRVAVLYAETNMSGVTTGSVETSWLQNDTSVTLFGTKEKRFSMQAGTATQAAAFAARALAEYKYPRAEHQFMGGVAKMTAEVTCRGWWDTIGWTYYANLGAKESYEEIGIGIFSIGETSTVQKCAQSFQCATGMGGASTIRLRVKREETPTDNLVVKLCANNAGVPGTVLASSTVVGSTIDENLKWHEFELSARVDLTAATTYWILVERSGATDAVNYYKVDANEDLGYASGSMKLWNGSGWAARAPDADMLFSVGGQAETTAQLSTILSDGEFITAVDLECASGIYSPSYRDGRCTALVSVEELLESGGPNGRRLTGTVDVNRRVRVYEETAAGTLDYFMSKDGTLSDVRGRKIETGRWPAGVWVRLKDVIPDNLDLNVILDAQRVFIDQVIYEAATGIVRFVPRTRGVLEVE